jgi:AcrR family transcriptional regulator
VARGDVLRDRTAAAIIDTAAQLFAEQGPAVSMEQVASAMGIGRATLYRYFPGRGELLAAMAEASIGDLAARIRAARLETVPVEEAVARLARAIVAAGSSYLALSGGAMSHIGTHASVDSELGKPIRALIRRGIKEGALRRDVGADMLFDLFSGLMRGALNAATNGGRGVEEAASAATTIFLRGASTEPA